MRAFFSNNLTRNNLLLSALVLGLLIVPNLVWASGVKGFIWGIVVGFFGAFLAIGGIILNTGINDFVIGFGDLFQNKGIGLAINTVWLNVRDLFNITFIFGLVYIGFKMILNADDSNTKRWLINLIIAALLVNFSLYFTKFIVDLSNIAATQIAQTGFLTAADDENSPFSEPGDVLVSDTYMNSLGLTSFYGDGGLKENIGVMDDGSWLQIFAAMIFFIIATFVFAAGGLLLIIRFVALLLYMTLSPLMFIGWVFPQLQRYTSMYWSGFLSRAFMAPLYIFFLYIGSKILYSYTRTVSEPNLAGALNNKVEYDLATSLMPFVIGCIVLMAAITISQRMSDQAASGSMRIGQAVTNRTRRVVIGAHKRGAAPLSVVARGGSNRVGNFTNRKLDQWQKDSGWRGKIGRNVLVSDTVGGAATKLKSNKFGLQDTADQVKSKKDALNRKYQSYQDIKAAQAASANPGAPNHAAIIAKGVEEANKMSPKELAAMQRNDKQTFEYIVGQINASKYDNLMESDDFDPTQKADMLAQRQKAINSTIRQNGVLITENLQKMSIKQIETMGDAFVRSNAHLFTDSQMDDLKKSKIFTDNQTGD